MAAANPEFVTPVPVEEVGAWVRSSATTFLQDRYAPDVQASIEQLAARWDARRAWGFRDGGRWVATLRTERRRVTVPGPAGEMGDVEVDALTNVTVAATHRRQGLMRRMLESSLRAARERGEIFSVLIAAEWPIYGRFGYAPATLTADYVLHRNRPGAWCSGETRTIRQVELDEVGAVAPALFDRLRRQWAGQMDRDGTWWQRNLGLADAPTRGSVAPNWFLHDGQEGIDGLLGWSPAGSPSLVAPEQRVDVQMLFTTSEPAYRNLWAYLTAIDLIDQVRLRDQPVTMPVRWLLHDPRALIQTRQVDFLWVRLLDVPGALSARTYPVDGELVLEVEDPGPFGFAAGRYKLTAGTDGAMCEPTRSGADIRIEQRALASIYLGGFRLAELSLTGMAQELRPGALKRADLLFSTPGAPWNATWF